MTELDSNIDGLFIRPLCEGDEVCLREWLTEFLRAQISLWAQSLKLQWTAEFVEAHVERTGLVEHEFSELAAAALDPLKLIRVACVDDEPVGVVYAESRMDRYLSETIGVLSWIYVVPSSRGRMIADRLVKNAVCWMNENDFFSSEVFVTSSNSPALGLYRRSGYVEADARLLLRLPSKSRTPEF